MNNLLILAQAEPAAATIGPVQIIFGLVYLCVCLAMIGAILMKTPKNDGFGGMMGGSTDTTSFKGAKSKDDTIDTITNWIALVFIFMSIGLNYVF